MVNRTKQKRRQLAKPLTLTACAPASCCDNELQLCNRIIEDGGGAHRNAIQIL